MESISTAIQKLNVSEELAISLKERFEPFEKQAQEWEGKAKALVVTDASQKDLMADARAARLALRQIRLAVEKKHAAEKAEFLRKSQILDLIKRTLVGYIEPLEAHLQEQEDFAKVQEEKVKAALYNERLEALQPYRMPMDGLQNIPLADMPKDAFDTLLMGLKAGHEARENQKKEAERIRLENEQKAKDERERVKAENEKLKRTQARAQRLTSMGFQWNDNHNGYVIELGSQNLKIDEIDTVGDEEFNAAITTSETIIKTFREKQKQEADALAAKLKAETEAREKLEKEKQEREAKEEAERKRIASEKRKAARAPDKVKLLNLAERITLIEPVEGLKDEEATKIATHATELLAKVVNYIRENAQKL